MSDNPFGEIEPPFSDMPPESNGGMMSDEAYEQAVYAEFLQAPEGHLPRTPVSLLVVLEPNLSIEYVEELMRALRLFQGVIDVQANVPPSLMALMSIKAQVRNDLFGKMLDIIRGDE